jgi:hypothetical protein
MGRRRLLSSLTLAQLVSPSTLIELLSTTARDCISPLKCFGPLELRPILRYPERNIIEFFKMSAKPLLKIGLLRLVSSGIPGKPKIAIPKEHVSVTRFLNRLAFYFIPRLEC